MTGADPDDTLLALQLFDGKLVIKRRKGSSYKSAEEGLFHIAQLTEQEREKAHAALSRILLAGNPSAEILGRLAAAFAPEGDPKAGPVKATVSLRGANVPDQEVHAAQMLLEVQSNRFHRGMNLEDAQAAVDEKHGYRGAARSLWENPRWRDLKASVMKAMPLPEKGRD